MDESRAGEAPVDRTVGRREPERAADGAQPAACCYCGKTDAEWTAADLKQGRRIGKGYIEYHCYTAYALD